jgi:ribosome-binding protein aMBF1 (putative translation factor)
LNTQEASGAAVDSVLNGRCAYDRLTPDFAVWLHAWIQERGWSQEHTAREIDVFLSAVRRWPAGETQPRYADLWKILQALGELPF